jgi:methyl-accepting chemotaxis protein
LENKEISVAVETISQEVAVLSGGISESVELIKEAAFSLDDLRRISEQMTGTSVKLGVATDDTLFINHVKKIARAIGSAFEDGVKKGYLDRQDLFDQTYTEIHGTNPVQYETRYTWFVDKVLPEIQEPVLELSDRVVFCAAVDVNGYLPTHNLGFSHPQRPDDPDWNAANARNRRIFDDRVGLAAGQNTDDFLLQAYRRDMGNGQFALMTDLSAPIYVHDQHWGGVRLAYPV